MPEMPNAQSMETLLREASAARAARFQYARAFDRFMDEQATLLRKGNRIAADGAAWHAAIVLRAYRAEAKS